MFNLFSGQQVQMDVDEPLEAEPEDEAPTKMNVGEASHPEQADTSAPPASAALVTPPTSIGNGGRESSLATTPAPLLHSAVPGTSTTPRPAPPTIGRIPVVIPLAPSNLNHKISSLGVGASNSSGSVQRSYIPPPQGPASNTSWRQSQSQLGNHSKSNSHLTVSHSQLQTGVSLSTKPGPPASPGILPRPSVNPNLPPGRSALTGPTSYNPVRPAGLANRFSSTSNPGANSGEPAATGQGHIDIANRKVVLQGVSQTP